MDHRSSASASTTVKFLELLEKLDSISDQTTEMLDWGLWAIEVPSVVDSGAVATPVPGGLDDDKLIARTDAIRAAASAIEIPPFENPLPILQPLAEDWDLARNQNSAQVQVFTDACIELIERKQGLSLLKAQHAQLSQLLKLLSDVARLFGEVSAMVPDYEWAKAWAFPQVSIEMFYVPAITSAWSTVGIRLDELSQGMVRRRGELESASIGLRNALAEEAFRIQAEADRLRLLKEELDARHTALEAEAEQIRRMNVDLDALDLDIVELDGQVASARERQRQLNRDISSWSSTISEQHQLMGRLAQEKCPLGATYVDCVQHPSFVNDIRSRIKSAQDTIADRQRAIGDARRELSGIPGLLDAAQRRLAVKIDERNELGALIDERTVRLAADRDQLGQEVQDWLKQSWSSRALVHDRANKDDGIRIEELRRRTEP
jgi:hypothetical protein